MVVPKRYILFFCMIVLAGVGLTARRDKPHHQRCKTKESCLNNPNCQCYCSGIAGYRDKIEEDNPVYVETNEYIDSNGEAVHCFCKPWDKEKFPGPAERD